MTIWTFEFDSSLKKSHISIVNCILKIQLSEGFWMLEWYCFLTRYQLHEVCSFTRNIFMKCSLFWIYILKNGFATGFLSSVTWIHSRHWGLLWSDCWLSLRVRSLGPESKGDLEEVTLRLPLVGKETPSACYQPDIRAEVCTDYHEMSRMETNFALRVRKLLIKKMPVTFDLDTEDWKGVYLVGRKRWRIVWTKTVKLRHRLGSEAQKIF